MKRDYVTDVDMTIGKLKTKELGCYHENMHLKNDLSMKNVDVIM